MPRVLSLFDIMPCPRVSLPVTEMVSPLKPLEALSSGQGGRPVGRRARTGTSPAPDEDRALLFPAGDAEGLADVLRRLIDQPDLRDRLGSGRAGSGASTSGPGRTSRPGCAPPTPRPRTVNRGARRARGRAPELSALRVGLVADEFTSETLAATVHAVALDRDAWRSRLESRPRPGLHRVGVVGQRGPVAPRCRLLLDGGARRLRRAARRSPESEASPRSSGTRRTRSTSTRFVRTASLCDHVFTTDGNRVVPYLSRRFGTGAGRRPRSRSTRSPRIHNPLPGGRPFDPSVAYAGTFYGERYAKRSEELSRLLETVRPFGLAIYDRQARRPGLAVPLPPDASGVTCGARLPYDEVIDSYKAHLANLNVNSVAGSPSMFSRRVVEVAACGGVVLSGPGRGIDETFGSAIPTQRRPGGVAGPVARLGPDPQARLREAWLQMRAVLRAHTVGTALTIVARTAGHPRRGRAPADVCRPARSTDDRAVVEALARQSVLPDRGVVRGARRRQELKLSADFQAARRVPGHRPPAPPCNQYAVLQGDRSPDRHRAMPEQFRTASGWRPVHREPDRQP